MPTVPRITGPSVRTAPLPGVRPSVEALAPAAPALEAVTQGLARARQVEDFRIREREKVDEIRVNAADVALRAAQSRLLLDPKSGVLQQSGLNAQTAGEKVDGEWTREVSRIESGLATDEQRALFRVRADRLKVETSARVMSHMGNELRKVDDDTFRALQDADASKVGELAREGDRSDLLIRDTVDAAQQRVTLYADRNGWTPERTAQARLAMSSQLRMVQVAGLLEANRPDLAALAVTEWADQFTPQDRAKAQGAIAAGQERAVAQAAEDRILQQYPDDERAALAEARKLTGEARDQVVSRVTARYAEQRRLLRETHAALVADAEGIVEQTGDWSRIPAPLWAQLAEVPGAQTALKKQAQQMRDGVEPETDWDLWTDITEMSAKELAESDPRLWRSRLSPQLYKEVTDRRAAVLGTGGRAGTAPEVSMTAIDRTLLTRARSLGLIGQNIATPGQLKGALGARYGQMRQAVMDEVARMRDEKKAKLTPQDVTTAMQTVLDDMVLQEGWFGGGQAVPRAFAAPGASVRDLTPEERAGLGLGLPPLRPGTTRAARWDELVRAGVDSATAQATVERELPRRVP